MRDEYIYFYDEEVNPGNVLRCLRSEDEWFIEYKQPETTKWFEVGFKKDLGDFIGEYALKEITYEEAFIEML